jgi:hypothetical protein
MKAVVGAAKVDANVEPTMGAEDFAFMLQAKPGCYVFIGNGEGDAPLGGHGLGPCQLHNGSYDFNDQLLPIGASYWVRLVEMSLPGEHVASFPRSDFRALHAGGVHGGNDVLRAVRAHGPVAPACPDSSAPAQSAPPSGRPPAARPRSSRTAASPAPSPAASAPASAAAASILRWSFSWLLTCPPGMKFRSSMRWPCTSRMRLPAKPPRIASRTAAGSAPAACASSKASATTLMVAPTISWLHSLATWPLPAGPTSVGAAQHAQHRFGLLEIVRAAAGHDGQRARLGAAHAAGHRRVDEAAACSRQARMEGQRFVLAGRTHVDPQRARRQRRQRRVDHLPTTGPASSIEITMSAPRTASCSRGGEWRRLAQGFGLGRGAVPGVERIAGLRQPGRHRLAHQADAEECQGRKCHVSPFHYRSILTIDGPATPKRGPR